MMTEKTKKAEKKKSLTNYELRELTHNVVLYLQANHQSDV